MRVERPWTLRLRVNPALTDWTFVNLGSSGGAADPSLVGGSLGLELFGWVAVEGAVSMNFTGHVDFGLGFTAGVRAGIAPRLLDDRNDRRAGTMLTLPVLAAYEYIDRSGSPDGCTGHERTHGLGGFAGLEATHWLSSSVGFSERLLLGAIFPAAQWRTGCWEEYLYDFDPEQDLDYALHAGLQFGIAF
jgi:hypothetical protein